MIKDENSEFKIEQGNTIINNGTIENNGTYINEGKTKYEIIIENIPGCEITSNLTIAEEGETIQLTTQPKEGYIFKGYKAYKIDDKNTVVKIENNSFTMPEYAVVIEAIVEQEQYNLVEGQNNKFTINSNQNLIFKTDGKYNLFEGIKIDNNLISKENYKVEEGSTIITLNASYLNSLSVGKHKLDILYNNGTVVSSDFEITSNVIKEKDETPKMGSNTIDNTFLFIVLIIISLFGIITTKKIRE